MRGMCSHMRIQSGSQDKTLEGHVRGMCSHMRIQSGSQDKTLAAYVTLKRPFAGVGYTCAFTDCPSG